MNSDAVSIIGLFYEIELFVSSNSRGDEDESARGSIGEDTFGYGFVPKIVIRGFSFNRNERGVSEGKFNKIRVDDGGEVRVILSVEKDFVGRNSYDSVRVYRGR